MSNTGIYQIRNLTTNKKYIGRASYIDKRKSEHFRTLRNNNHTNTYLQKAYNKYGIEDFEFSILELCKKEELIEKEHYWCRLLKVNNSLYGYNLALTNELKGFYKHSEETKEKISRSHKGKKKSSLTIEKIRQINKGKKHTQETKDKIKDWFKNNEHPMKMGHSEETKIKMSSNRKGKPSNNRKNIKVIVNSTEELFFKSITEASLYFNVKITSICNNLKGLSQVVRSLKNKLKFEYE